MNELLFFVEVFFVFLALILVHKFFGKVGIFVWIGLMGVLSQIFVTKQIDLFGIQTTMANVEFASLFLAIDILNECYGEKEARKAPNVFFFFVTFYIILSQLMLLFKPNDLDYVQSSMFVLLSQSPRICIASILMMFFAGKLNVRFFSFLSKKFKRKKLWLRNNISTIVCNCSENFAFTFLAFYKNPIVPMSLNDVIIISLSASLIETIVALLDTPFVYLAKYIKKEKIS